MAKLLGKTSPRLWTPPLRTLNRRTSDGYRLDEFSSQIGYPFDPWQRWLGIHLLEQDQDDNLRFRTATAIAGRQCGKSQFSALLALYFLYVKGARLVLSAAQDLGRARDHMRLCLEIIESSPWLDYKNVQTHGASGDEWFQVPGGGKFKITAANRRAARGASADLVLIDELREVYEWDAYAALGATTLARDDALIFATSNAGDSRSKVLAHRREAAQAGKDPALGLFEWSASPGASIHDWAQIRQAMPGLGFSVSRRNIEALIADQPLALSQNEILGLWVDLLNQAIDAQAWEECRDQHGSLAGLKDRLSVCVDASPDAGHVTLAIAAPLPNGGVRVEINAAWPSTEQARAELPARLAKIRPRVISWYPGGAAGTLASILRPRPGVEPPGLDRARPGNPSYAELAGVRVPECCMMFADLVKSRLVEHPGDELLTAQVRGAEKLYVGADNAWRYTRKGDGSVDSVYAASGAVAMALQIPAAKKVRLRMLPAA